MSKLLVEIRKRDSQRCVACGIASGALEVHHIVYRSQGGPDDARNLVTLCRECHRDAHSGRSERLRATELQWMVWEGRPGRWAARRALQGGKCLGCANGGPGTADPLVRATSRTVYCTLFDQRFPYDYGCSEFVSNYERLVKRSGDK